MRFPQGIIKMALSCKRYREGMKGAKHMTGQEQGRQSDGKMIGRVKNCVGIIRRIEGKYGSQG